MAHETDSAEEDHSAFLRRPAPRALVGASRSRRRRNAPLGSCPQRAVSGPDSARRRMPRLARATGVLKGRANESPPRVHCATTVVEAGLHPDYSRVARPLRLTRSRRPCGAGRQ
jgi:hypothetical protein